MPQRDWRELLPRIDRVLELAQERLGRIERAPRQPEPETLCLRWSDGLLEPIQHPDLYPLDGLLGVEQSIARLKANASAFCRGLPAFDTLLYGERGTGKSSAVRGLVRELGPAGLRLVEVRRGDILDLPRLFAALRDREGRFALFCDDLSFEDGDPSYKELKVLLDGGLEARPANVIIVGTSNRRHLIPERVSENLEAALDSAGELHPGETAEEKLSLSDRFGLLLPFFAFDQKTFLEIVDYHARAIGIWGRLDKAELHSRALQTARQRGSRSGRVARQACVALLQELEGESG